jgi:hypothetical protein
MAELDPGKVSTLGFDPGTGSPLSQEVRNALLKKSTIDRSVFRNELLESENRKKDIDTQNTRVIQSQEQALLGFNSNIQALRNDIGKLGTGLAGIALLLQQDNAEEVSRTKAEQERERRLAEQRVRIGKESQIEQNIQNALVTPVKTLVPKVNDIFGKIGTALGILFGGWLTKQVVDAMKASEEGNTKLFNDIKSNIIKNLAIVGGGLLAIKVGFSLVKTTIGRIASGLTKLLIAKPLALAAGLLRINGGGPKTTGPGPKSGRGGKFGGIGRFVTFLSALMNFKNKEYIDGILGALSLASRAPGAIGAIGKIAGIAFTADEIAEAFGKNIFTDSGFNQKVDEIAKIFKKGDQNNKPTISPKPTPSSAPPAPPTAQPQTPMMGDKPSSSAPSPEMVSKFEQAWKMRNFGPARSQIEDAWSKMSPEQKQQAMAWAASKGYDWNEMKLPNAPTVISSQSNQQSSDTSSASPAQVSSPTKPPTQVGQLPEPQPSITMIRSSNNANQQANVPLTNGSLTDVPLINSANPDNFYVLYSQLSYNVVT